MILSFSLGALNCCYLRSFVPPNSSIADFESFASVQGSGMFELVDLRFGSAFQDLFDDFCQSVTNFTTIDRRYRYWSHSNGSLHCVVVCSVLIIARCCNLVVRRHCIFPTQMLAAHSLLNSSSKGLYGLIILSP